MDSYERLLELKKKREEYVRVSQENNMWEGTKKILTDMYPDTAHFVYELLQNAEDMCATQVYFALYNDKLVFSHNGTRRDFIFEDIDSITSIGNNTLKKDDTTSIGTFGVGFKAVYTYTSTPEIHSGEFDFRIRDMFIPDPTDVPKTAVKGTTKFIFPFDHKVKTPQEAVEQIKDALIALDENAILFLSHIKEIVYKLPDKSLGGVKFVKSKDKNGLAEVIAVNALNGEKKKSYWLKLSKDRQIKTVKGDAKLPIALAFKMEQVKDGANTYYHVDSTLKGNVFIYFPAEKEQSNLHFHIHAPFASTVARDSVRNCPENNMLMNMLAELAVESISFFKKEGYINYSYYAALPNRRDFSFPTKYKIIYDEIIKTFKNPSSELIVTEGYDYKKVADVKQGNRDITRLIEGQDLQFLYGKYWIPALVPQTREETFLYEVGVTTYERRNLAESIIRLPKFKELLERKISDTGWFIRLYEQLNGVQNLHSYLSSFAEIEMIKCKDGRLHSADEGLFIESSYVPQSIKNPIYVDLSKSVSKSIDEAAVAFLKNLGVRVMTQEIDVMSDLEERRNVQSDDVVLKLLEILEQYKETNKIEQYKDSAFILGYRIQDDGKLYRITAQECCWSSEVAFFYEGEYNTNFVLARDYYESLNEEDWALFKTIFAKLGGKIVPEIKLCSVDYEHPDWKRIRSTRATVNKDYTITGLKNLHKISELGLYKESLILWDVVVKDKNVNHHKASYGNGMYHLVDDIESRLAYYLRRLKWIPNKEGIFCRLCDVTANDLYEGFIYSDDAIFLNNLGFGDETQAPDDITTILEKAGVSISEADEEWFRQSDEMKAEILKLLKERKERKRMSLEEAISEENREQRPYEEEDYDEYERDISVTNVEGRERRQIEEFEKGLKKDAKIKPVLSYTYNSKTSAMEKQYMQERYKGKCQICGRLPIRKHNGDVYFEAINIINTSRLDKQLLNDIDVGWNTLCLCPNCAAEYRYCAKSLSTFEQQVETIQVVPSSNEYINITIELNGVSVVIHFDPKHFLALKSAFKVYKKHN